MIKFTFKKLPVDESGKSYDSMEAFQTSMLAKLLDKTPINDVPSKLVESKETVMEILTLNYDCRPGARGKPKKRKANPAPELELKEGAAA